MKTIILGICFFMGLSVCGYCETANSRTINRIVAVVNDEIITQAELEHKKDLLLRQIKETEGYSQEISEADHREIENALAERLIINKLVVQEAKRQNIEAADEEIKEMVNKVKKKFSNDATFRASLRQTGLSLEDLNESYKFDIIMRKMFFDKIRQTIVVTPAEIDEFYRQHRTEFQRLETVKLSNILIKKEGRSPEEISARLEAILALIKEGADFKETARKHSEGANAFKGGEMGEIKRGELSSNIEEIIFGLKPNQISEWIETESGLYLFRIEEFLPARMLDFNEAQAQIKTVLFNQKMNEKFDKWVAQLREKAYIEIIDQSDSISDYQDISR